MITRLRSARGEGEICGAVAEAVDLMAESSAPKNSTCMAKGMYSSTKVGMTFCGSSLSRVAAFSGITISALTTMNMGTKANTM